MGTKFEIHYPAKNMSIKPGVVIAWGDYDSNVVVTTNLIFGVLLAIDQKAKPAVVPGNTHTGGGLWAVVFPQVVAADYVLEIWKLKNAGGARDRILGRRRFTIASAIKDDISLDAPATGSTVYLNFFAGGTYNGDGVTPVTCAFSYGAANPDGGTPVNNPGSGMMPYWLQSHSIPAGGVPNPVPNCSYQATYKLTVLNSNNITLSPGAPGAAQTGDD
jgi:hypothetical protein